ncbi:MULTISPECIES: PAS domain S-box protein [Cyanophyceae]|uniref:PAS domain S-box protein n=1 Tax=Cyanophyceae TaxID=3028117 RepID=UPI001686720D|nr:PAS domain S-box protein [Trichocoleus sp. FACHB-69]MBD1930399.1 PAS domain S-box protein [Trichocoleus sp. FACHB-69]
MVFGNSISDQRNPQVTLQTEEELQLTKFLMDRGTDAIFCVAPDAHFLYVNDAICRLLGYSREELLSMTMHDVDPDFSPKVWSEYWRTIKQQGSLYFESLHLAKDDQSFPVEIAVTYLEFYGRECGYIFVRDITRRKQAEVEIRATLQHEKELGEQRAHFISVFRHEFRNLLNIVSFSTSLLRRHSHQWTEEKKQPYIERIRTAVEQLSQLLDQVKSSVEQKQEN